MSSELVTMGAPALLGDLLAKAYKFTLADGKKKTLEMKTGG